VAGRAGAGSAIFLTSRTCPFRMLVICARYAPQRLRGLAVPLPAQSAETSRDHCRLTDGRVGMLLEVG
jgi:hypothetical protein